MHDVLQLDITGHPQAWIAIEQAAIAHRVGVGERHSSLRHRGYDLLSLHPFDMVDSVPVRYGCLDSLVRWPSSRNALVQVAQKAVSSALLPTARSRPVRY